MLLIAKWPKEILMNGKGGLIVPINNIEILVKTLDNIVLNEKIVKKINIAKKKLKI